MSRRRRPGQRGVALILVLWTFTALSVLAAEFARAMHDEAASTRNFKESTQARFVAIAGLNEAVLALEAFFEADNDEDVFEDPESPDPVRALSHGDGHWVEASFDGVAYELRMINEGGKLSLNKISPDLLMLLLENLEIPDDHAATIADSIVDWTDDDDFHGPNGAENDYYESLSRPYRAKNAPFDTIEELLLVRGVTEDIFYGSDGLPGLVDLFTVFHNSTAINTRAMTPAVMQALFGFDGQQAGEFGDSRRRGGSDAVVGELESLLRGTGVSAHNRGAQRSTVTIEARVRDASGQVVLAHIGAVLDLPKDGDGLRVYRWYDSIFADSDDRAGASAGRVAG